MSDIVNDDDLSALAAEYVLGTLEPDERTRANVLLDVDHGFRGLVRVWEHRFGELHLMVEPVEPDAKIWQRIKGKLGAADAPSARPSAPPLPAASAPAVRSEPVLVAETPAAAFVPAAAVVPSASPSETKPDAVATAEQKLAELINEVGRFEKRPTEEEQAEEQAEELTEELAVDEVDDPRVLEHVSHEPAPPVLLAPDRPRQIVRPPAPQVGGWRAMALVMALVAFGLGGLIAAWRYAPERLPRQLQPRVVLNLSQGPTGHTPAPHGTQFEE